MAYSKEKTVEELAREIVRFHIGAIPVQQRLNVQPALELSIAAALRARDSTPTSSERLRNQRPQT